MSRVEEWRRINEVFHAALARPRTERTTFLESACADAPELRREVEALIAAYEADPTFLESGFDPLTLAAASVHASDDSPIDSPPLAAGSRLGRYVVEEELGRGGMGVVYLARDTELNRFVAIKLLPAAVAKDGVRRARLRREAQAAAALTHPGIATVYALEDVDGVLFIVSEYIRGQTLRDALEASGPFKGKDLLRTATDIARALAAAHRQGVVHRDLKPENVIQSEHGIKIVDFGLAQVAKTEIAGSLPTRLTHTGVIVGTPAYMSPEQLRGEEADTRSDQFMYGVLLYELIAGHHPFGGAKVPATWARILSDEPPPLERVADRVVIELQPLVARCLAKDPAERFPTTDDLVSAVVVAHRTVANERRQSGEGPERAAPFGSSSTAHPHVAGDGQSPSRLWWEVHQVVVSLVYGVMLWPMGLVHGHMTPGAARVSLFVANVAAVAVAATLRLNLAFTSRCYPAALGLQRRRVSWLVRSADWAVVLLLLIGAAIVGRTDVALTALLVGVAIGAAVAFLFIEPATAHATFGEVRSRHENGDSPHFL